VKTDLKAYGGSGYSFVAEQFIPYLRRMGVTQEQITRMVVDNPRRLLTLARPEAVR
jgi:phosphotriesterase-related protein